MSNSHSPWVERTLLTRDWEYLKPLSSETKMRPVSLLGPASVFELMCRMTAPSEVSRMVYHFSSSSPMPDGSRLAFHAVHISLPQARADRKSVV